MRVKNYRVRRLRRFCWQWEVDIASDGSDVYLAYGNDEGGCLTRQRAINQMHRFVAKRRLRDASQWEVLR